MFEGILINALILLAIFIFYIYQLSKIRIIKEESSLGKEKEKISWREGAVLLFIYFIFLTISFGGYRV